MALSVSYRRFTDSKNRTHFLLKEATLTFTVFMANAASLDVPTKKVGRADVAFSIDFTPEQLPSTPTRAELTFEVPVTLDGQTFPTLRVVQIFGVMQNRDAAGEPTYALVPSGWRDSLQRLRVANMATHPLLDVSLIAAGNLTLNALVLDLTEAWLHLHRDNTFYKRHALFTTDSTSTFKVFAHLGGNPFIWYASIPGHLNGISTLSAHVFYSPADNTEAQNNYNEEQYLKSNTKYFKEDGSRLFNYLLPPVADVDVDRLTQGEPKAPNLRNVVGIGYLKDKAGKVLSSKTVTTLQWRIGAGFEKAFITTGGGKPAQFLLMPQRPEGGSNGYAVTAHLKVATDTIVDVLQTNTSLLSGGADIVATKDKLVLSCYSESGYDIWYSAKVNQDQIKAIVCIEPQNLNAIQNDYRPKDAEGNRDSSQQAPIVGKDIIPVLLKKQVAVFIIGRHHLQYHPQVADIGKVRLLPAHPDVIFAYPPNPSGNDFVKYRVQRIADPASDPLLLPEEKEILDDLAAKGFSGAAALPKIFTLVNNQDRTPDQAGVQGWYSHQFALSGGEEMHFDPSAIYDTPVTYRTFFETAVAEIG